MHPQGVPDPKRDEVAEDNNQTEHEETNENPEPEPEKGTGEAANTQDSAGKVDATHEPDDTGQTGAEGAEPADDVDWRSKADLYKAQMRKQEKRAKDNHAENERLKAELDKLKQKATEEAAPKQEPKVEDPGGKQDQETKPDPVLARMDEIAAKLATLEAESDRLKAENAAAKHSQMVAEVAAEKGLTVDQAQRLRGDSREELEADADEVIALFGLNKTKSPGPAPKPREKRPQRGGATNPDDTDTRSREDILTAVLNTGRRAKKA